MDISPLYNEKELFLRIAEGDEKAFRLIFHHYYPRLLPFVTKITKDQPQAEEIVQEIFLRLWKYREDFEQTDYLGSWLFKVGSNLSVDFLKRAALHDKLALSFGDSLLEHANETFDRLDEKESRLLIHKAVNHLPPQQKQIFKLSREKGLSHQQIASQMNISPNTVKNHLVKALQTIRHFLKTSAGIFFSLLIIIFLKNF